MNSPGFSVQVSAPPRFEPASQPGPVPPGAETTTMSQELAGEPVPPVIVSQASVTVMSSQCSDGLKSVIVQSTTLLPAEVSVAHCSTPLQNTPSLQSASLVQVFLGETHDLKIDTPWRPGMHVVPASAAAGKSTNAPTTTSTTPIHRRIVRRFCVISPPSFLGFGNIQNSRSTSSRYFESLVREAKYCPRR